MLTIVEYVVTGLLLVLASVLGLLASPDMAFNRIALWIVGVASCATVAVADVKAQKKASEVVKRTCVAGIVYGAVLIGAYRLIVYETQPKLSGEIHVVIVGSPPGYEFPSDSPDALFAIHLTLRNDGVPTAIAKWTLSVTIPGEKPREGEYVRMNGGIYHLRDKGIGTDIQFNGDADDLAMKVRQTPITVGARPNGVVIFEVFDMSPIGPRTKDTLIHVTFSDDSGHTGVAEYTMTGHRLMDKPGQYEFKPDKPFRPEQLPPN